MMLTPSRVRLVRRARQMALISLFATSGGCYQYGSMPTAGAAIARTQTVELLLNERGRADLVGRIGTDALSLEGVLVERQDSSVTVDVQSVTYLNRTTSKWSGERLSVTSGQLRDIRSKRLSITRTGSVVGIFVAGMVAFIASRGIAGGGDSSPPGGGPTVIQ